MKRKLSLLLAVVMILGSFSFAFADDDFDPALFLEEKGVLLGDTTGDLMLEDTLERRDAVIMLSRLLGEEDEAKVFEAEGLPTWEDNNDGNYNGYLAWAQANEYFEGHSELRFGPREDITAREYAVVLLRALGYVEEAAEWKEVFDTAKELGLLEGVEKDADEAIIREEMAVMTVAALRTALKDSEETLADKLSIEFPEPEVLEVEEVYADNLMEIKVVFNKDVDDELVDTELYSTTAGDIEDAFVENDNVLVLVLKSEMKNKKDYTLTVDGTENVDGKYAFTAYDNAVPEVVDVVALGTKAVKVTMSEPVKNVSTRSFRLDGKSYFGALNVVGREITLTPYGNVLTVGDHELSVSSLEDYAGFKSLETVVAFEVVEDTVAPEVVDVTGTTERIIVTFSEDVDPATVTNNSLYWNRKANTGTKVQLAGNRFAFDFKDSLPIYEVTLYIQGVKDYSGNEMEAVELPYKGQLDDVRPEVVEAYVDEDNAKLIIAEFSKTMDKDDVEKEKNYTVLDEDDKAVRIRDTRFAKDSNKVVEIELYNELKKDKEYTLKIEGLRDTTKLKNTMLPYEGVVVRESEASVAKAEIADVVVEENSKNEVVELTVMVSFGKEMAIETIADLDNYLVEVNKELKLLSTFDDVDLEVIDNGKAVIITFDEDAKDKDKITGIAVLGARDIDDKLISNHGVVLTIADKGQLVFDDEKGAVAKSKTEVVVKFNQAIVDADEDNFVIINEAEEIEIDVKKALVDGTKEVVLELEEELPASTAGYEVKVVDELVTRLGEKAVTATEPIKDEIAPSLVEVIDPIEVNHGSEGYELKVTLKFDEPLSGYGVAYVDDLVIERLEDGKVFKADKEEIETSYTEDKVTVTIKVENPVEAISEYAVSIVDPVYIKDVAGNVVNETDDEVIFEVSEDDVAALVNAAKTKLQDKIAEVDELIESEYTSETWEALQTALEAANGVVNDEDATLEEVQKALTDLTDAIDKLEKVEEVEEDE